MATRIYHVSPGYTLEDITEGAGSATTQVVELTVGLATSLIYEGSTTRGILKKEVLICLELLEQYITRSNWPPA